VLVGLDYGLVNHSPLANPVSHLAIERSQTKNGFYILNLIVRSTHVIDFMFSLCLQNLKQLLFSSLRKVCQSLS
jgi:hypothetical protein